MTKLAFTSGEWPRPCFTIQGPYSQGKAVAFHIPHPSKGSTHPIAECRDATFSPAELRANANLISMAKTLYALLEEARTDLAEQIEADIAVSCPNNRDGTYDIERMDGEYIEEFARMKDRLARMDAALSQVRGEE